MKLTIASSVIGTRTSLPRHRILPSRRLNARVIAVRAMKGEEVHCYVNEEGHLVCDRLDPGDYVVKGVSSTKVRPCRSRRRLLENMRFRRVK